MFNWFTPKCPLDTRDKAWVEWRMLWLANCFGIARLQNARVILPTEEFFPDPYSGDEASARKYLDRMCGYMGIDPHSVNLNIVPDDELRGAVGIYEMRERSNIYVVRSQLAFPLQLMSTLAHELAHELLLKGNHLTQSVSDHELVTDLLPVFLGIGIFTANATVQSSSRTTGLMNRWSISRQGYLSSITLGYALALFAFVRGEDRPSWASELRTDSAVTFRAALRYLLKTNDSLFTPGTAGKPQKPLSPGELAEQLESKSPTFRLAALWHILEHSPVQTELVSAVERCLRDPDPDVQEGAASALGSFGPAASGAVTPLIDAAWHGTPATRLAATRALGKIRAAPSEVVPALAVALEDENKEVISAAAWALEQYSRSAALAEPQLLAAIEAAAYTNANPLDSLIAAFKAVSPDARKCLQEHFASHDPEVRRNALRAFDDR